MTTRKLTDHRSYILDAEQIRVFAANGHISLSGVATVAEIEQFQPAIKAAVAKYSSETRPLNERGTYGEGFPADRKSLAAGRHRQTICFCKRFARIAAELLGVEKVRLYHDQALFKEPLGGHTPWHQDQYYWPLNTDRTITMWMPLVDIDTQMGMLAFASGSHKSGPVGSIRSRTIAMPPPLNTLRSKDFRS
ncbi:MAG: phytanoyl-CoA dioxygenase family protein [Chloracidobacterium sp.]|nr:phytanoyl-CoA dioxygenase family protein [Chloracidobacterium sp.]